ncbi:MAG TPA: hypothetical protein VK540_22110, partial [Polyangiaceae bacterium]|nr:hypothetical protein [Polyangiaceae bacterium]
SAAKKGVAQDRAQLSLLLQRIDDLVGEIDASPGRCELGDIGVDVVDGLMATLGDCREMIGDEFEDVDGRAVWHIAVRPAMTAEQLRAELKARGVAS